MNVRNNRRAVFSMWSTLRPLRGKRASTTIERLCFLRGMCREVIKKDKEDRLSQLSFETPACRDMSFGAEELN
jgi:hypothetical protein